MPWRITYPPELPISGRRDEIVELLRRHQVVILAGDTGSGKTTQLPKLCLEAGRGRHGRIACTQPRRVAALSVSKRVAEELGVDWGAEVGCKIRFDDRTGARTRIKFLTDGMLLAEAQGDPLLRDYDTIIVDEAHERSLNIDFLIGLLRRLVDQRPGLQVIITSATIDTDAFSKAFGGAPIVQVSGRTYPVEVIYSPVDELMEERGDFTHIEAVAEAVERVLLESESGDVLVFLPTEREIRETCELLRGRGLGPVELFPLFGRLASGDQQRVFSTGGRRKVVVATNIAETSLTIPGIRFVVDTGLARISRFNPRTRTRRLPVEPVSRSSADQRKGRCGRVSEGVCIRLYSEQDYNDRPRFTQPEIQRCNLAEVILRMKMAGWGEMADFPFIDPPLPAAVRAGVQLLEELGALDDRGDLTELGRELGRLPVDPTLGRMLIQARREHALREVLVIATGLSVPDPRERPLDEEAKADAAHRRFAHPESDFLMLLQLWEAYHEDFERLSQGKLRRFCRDHYLSFNRMREWFELHEQVARALDDLGGFDLAQGAPEAGENPRQFGGSFYRAVHRSLLPGLLAHAGRHDEGPWYRMAGDRKAMMFPGSGLFRRSPPAQKRGPGEKVQKGPKPPEWVVCAEVVETSRLYARTVARIDPDWLVELGAHILKISHTDPFLVEEGGRVVVKETARLHGLEVRVRSVDYGRIEPVAATDIFVRECLVGERGTPAPSFLEHNRRVRDKVEMMRTRLRGVALGDVDEAAARFYLKRIEGVSNLHDLNRFIRSKGGNPGFLRMTEQDLLGELPQQIPPEAFPDSVQLQNSALPIDYAYRPGDERDGVTLRVPVQRARQLDAGMLDWLVPALMVDKVEHLLRALPKAHRVRLQPIAESAVRIARELKPVPGGLRAALLGHLCAVYGIELSEAEQQALELPPHLRTRVEVRDDRGRTLAAERDLRAVHARIEAHERELARRPDTEIEQAWARVARDVQKVSTEGQGWCFGTIPETVLVTMSAGVEVRGWPGLVSEPAGVALRLFRTPDEASKGRDAALRRLLEHALRNELVYAREDLRELRRHKLALMGFVAFDDLLADAAECLSRHLCEREVAPLTREAFDERAGAAKAEARGIAFKLIDEVGVILRERAALLSVKHPAAHIAEDLARLVPPRFLQTTPYAQLKHLSRYLKASAIRAERARTNPPADAERAKQVKQATDLLTAWARGRQDTPAVRRRNAAYRWALEELRVSLFAQQLGTAHPVSLVRLQRMLEEPL